MSTENFFFLQVFNLYDNSHLMILLFALAKWQEKHYDFHVHDFIKYLSSCIDFSLKYSYTVNFRYQCAR